MLIPPILYVFMGCRQVIMALYQFIVIILAIRMESSFHAMSSLSMFLCIYSAIIGSACISDAKITKILYSDKYFGLKYSNPTNNSA